MRLPPMTPHRLIKEDPSLGLWGDTMVAPPEGHWPSFQRDHILLGLRTAVKQGEKTEKGFPGHKVTHKDSGDVPGQRPQPWRKPQGGRAVGPGQRRELGCGLTGEYSHSSDLSLAASASGETRFSEVLHSSRLAQPRTGTEP